MWRYPRVTASILRLAASSGTQRARGWWVYLAVRPDQMYPSAAGRPGGDAEPGADLGPGIAVGAQALDRLGDGVVDLLGQADQEGQGLDIAVPDAAAEGAQDAADECGVLVVLTCRRAVWVST